ncbi:SCO family protein [Methylocystis sp. IM3]|uniref:SCO family protein n=1 Tax=unclassified Methylocystis TaxID=2625913 RepID=UPI0030FBD75B
MKRIAIIVAFSVLAQAAAAQPAPDIAGAVFEQRPGSRLPRPREFRDEAGRLLRLSDLLNGAPLALVLGYYQCPKLCDVLRAGLIQALAKSGMAPGRDYVFVAISVDPADTSATASQAKAHDLENAAAPQLAAHAHYLTGERDAIQSVADAVGFASRPAGERRTIAHPVGAVFVSPSGVVSNYLLGVGFSPADTRLAVSRAASGEISPPASPILLLCFDFDASTGRYSVAIVKVLRLLSIAMSVIIGLTLLYTFRREGSGA